MFRPSTALYIGSRFPDLNMAIFTVVIKISENTEKERKTED